MMNRYLTKEITNLFENMCVSDNIPALKLIKSIHNINNELIMGLYQHLWEFEINYDTALYLFSLLDKNIIISSLNIYGYFLWSCEYDNKYIFNIIYDSPRYIELLPEIIEEGFYNACETNSLYIAQKIHDRTKIFPIKIYQKIMVVCCENNDLEIMKWINTLIQLDLNYDDHILMCTACIHGYFDIIKWLYQNGAKIFPPNFISLLMACNNDLNKYNEAMIWSKNINIG